MRVAGDLDRGVYVMGVGGVYTVMSSMLSGLARWLLLVSILAYSLFYL